MSAATWQKAKMEWVKHWKECWNDAVRIQMNKIKKEFLGKCVLGAPASAMQVLSVWLMKKSRKVVSVSTSMKDEPVSLPKSKSQCTQLPDDDDEDMLQQV